MSITRMLVKFTARLRKALKCRYSPAECIGARKAPDGGHARPEAHSARHFAERQNLTMRMQMRRFTRLTNAFSKKFENHMQMVALYTVWYNYVKQHKSLKGLLPAMAAGISDTLWSMTDLAEMIYASCRGRDLLSAELIRKRRTIDLTNFVLKWTAELIDKYHGCVTIQGNKAWTKRIPMAVSPRDRNYRRSLSARLSVS